MVDVDLGGRGTAVGGDGNRGAVVVGDHNRVEVLGTLEWPRRQLEALTLGEVRSYVAPWLRHAPPAQPLLCRQGGEGLEQRQG
jgi:hypothetical protein